VTLVPDRWSSSTESGLQTGSPQHPVSDLLECSLTCGNTNHTLVVLRRRLSSFCPILRTNCGPTADQGGRGQIAKLRAHGLAGSPHQMRAPGHRTGQRRRREAVGRWTSTRAARRRTHSTRASAVLSPRTSRLVGIRRKRRPTGRPKSYSMFARLRRRDGQVSTETAEEAGLLARAVVPGRLWRLGDLLDSAARRGRRGDARAGRWGGATGVGHPDAPPRAGYGLWHVQRSCPVERGDGHGRGRVLGGRRGGGADRGVPAAPRRRGLPGAAGAPGRRKRVGSAGTGGRSAGRAPEPPSSTGSRSGTQRRDGHHRWPGRRPGRRTRWPAARAAARLARLRRRGCGGDEGCAWRQRSGTVDAASSRASQRDGQGAGA
jgi:hypothetical protein